MLKTALLTVVAVLLIALTSFKLLYGGGTPYPDISTEPALDPTRVETPIELPYPPGMVAASPDGRVFYTYHMLHQPERFVDSTVFEWVDGEGVPFPNQTLQDRFRGAMGITADRQNRLWIVKPGALAGVPTELLAVDRSTGELLVEHTFAAGEAGFAQDMRVSPDGGTVYLADTGLFRFTNPSLIVFDVDTLTAVTTLEGHPALSAQDWVMRKTDGSDYKLAFGLLTFVVGVDGIALTADGAWLYLATMSHDSVYRLPTAVLHDDSATDTQVSDALEFVGHKPMSDGIELLADGTLVVTDVENGGIGTLTRDGRYRTLTKTAQVDWADSVTVAPNGDIWFTDSRLTHLIDQFSVPADQATMLAEGPYPIYRVPHSTRW